jgi:hypothetical protein
MWQGEKWQWPGDLALNYDGTLAVVGVSNGLVVVCTVAAGNGNRFLCSFPGTPPYQFGPADLWVVTGRTNGGFQQVDVRTGTIKRTFPSRLRLFNGDYSSFEVSRSGRHVSVRNWRNEGAWIEVWNIVTGELLTTVAAGALPLKLGDIVFAYIHNMLIMSDLDCTMSAVPLLAWGCEPLQSPFLLISFNSSKRCVANCVTQSSLPDTESAHKISLDCGN